jgi:hypothetical protein
MRRRLTFFADHPGTWEWDVERYTRCHGKHASRRVQAASSFTICSGTIFGPGEAVLKLSRELIALMGTAQRGLENDQFCRVNDQPHLNVLLMRRGLSSAGLHHDADFGPVETVPWLAPGSAAVNLHFLVDAEACAVRLPPLLRAPPVHPIHDMHRSKKSTPAILHKWAQCNETRRAVARIMGSSVQIPEGFA